MKLYLVSLTTVLEACFDRKTGCFESADVVIKASSKFCQKEALGVVTFFHQQGENKMAASIKERPLVALYTKDDAAIFPYGKEENFCLLPFAPSYYVVFLNTL